MAASGVQVSMATSSDPKCPPEAIIDGNPSSYWTTTGLFPQEVILTFSSPTTLSSITTTTASVRKMVIEKSADEESAFEKVTDKEMTCDHGHRQSEEFKFSKPLTVKRLKLILAQGYEHFAAIYSVNFTNAEA